MIKIPCRYYLKNSLEMADFCINYDLNLSHKVFYLNSFFAIELLLKNLLIFDIYNRFKMDILGDAREDHYQKFLTIVRHSLKNKSHNLIELFNYEVSLKEVIKLKNVQKKENSFINMYSLIFEDDKEIFLVTSEAVRYNVFASKQNVLDIIDYNNIENIKELLKDIKKYIEEKIKY